MKSLLTGISIVFGLAATAALTSCGGGTNEVEGGLPGTGGSGADAIISITGPRVEAITKDGAGSYILKGSVVVTDSQGNTIPNGTRVDLAVIDTIKATGTIDPGTDQILNAILSDASPLKVDGAATTFTTAEVYRPFENRGFFLEAGDHVLLTNAYQADMVRTVSVNPANANQLTVNGSYVNPYPNSVFNALTPSRTTNYVVGSSSLGISIEGASGNRGFTTTVNGVGEFLLRYPANTSTILTGCTSVLDGRTDPVDAGSVLVAAQVLGGGGTAATISDRFCYAPVAGGSIAASPSAIGSVANATIAVTVRDNSPAGEGIPLPYTAVSVGVDGDATIVPAANLIFTDQTGTALLTVTTNGSAAGTSGSIILSNGDASGTVTVTIP